MHQCLHHRAVRRRRRAREACDDGNASNFDACTNACEQARCGDGFPGPGEACDDGDQVDGNGCDNDCTRSAPVVPTVPTSISYASQEGSTHGLRRWHCIASARVTVPVPHYEAHRHRVSVPAMCGRGRLPPTARRDFLQRKCRQPPDQSCALGRCKDLCDLGPARLPTGGGVAARNRGQQVTYPWGEQAANCDRANVNMFSIHQPGLRIPSRTHCQGLCDMAGGIYEWMEDDYHPSYEARR